MPYAIIHDGLLMPLFGCIILGLAGEIRWPRARLASAGLCRRGQLLPLPAPLQPLEPDPRLACSRSAGPEPLRSLDQLRLPDLAGASCLASGGKARATAPAQMDGRLALGTYTAKPTGDRIHCKLRPVRWGAEWCCAHWSRCPANL